MNDADVKNIINENQEHIERLKKMLLNILSVSNIRFWYWKLDHFRISENIYEDLMEMDALMTSIIVSYGRLFNSSFGSTRMNEGIVPNNLREMHKHILDLRNNKYAHHGGHQSIQPNISIENKGTHLNVALGAEIGTWLGAPQEWKELFEWLDGYMHSEVKKKLAMLTKLTGIEWKIQDHDAPWWIS
ncbi:hypothetical protein [Pedobacter endophyticus]|uniref:Uncharacterized protein n=1 Tax=Pedobacter endophyticus TaxID=2789740 RepID=A0A7U3SQ75_9SPHI|nr:hypothetical protein [Pedobacter endophyticus]QPH38644.1 hypothetical protein IZT61_16395 [Pedobacter endophyticus]